MTQEVLAVPVVQSAVEAAQLLLIHFPRDSFPQYLEFDYFTFLCLTAS